jgi:3-methyladenine DNA glycosylase AlkD
MLLRKLEKDLRMLANPEKAQVLQRFFKTGKGEYAEGDKFLGIIVPLQRQIAKKYQDLGFAELENLLSAAIHEKRLVALLILVLKNHRAAIKDQKAIYDFYVTHTHRVNNWDLVDLSAPYIVGKYLLDRDKSLLREFAGGKNLWRRRTAIVSTLHFIRNGYFKETLLLAKKLLGDQEDLIHKATGWMLREIGKRDTLQLENFLHQHAQNMPRTMLRYAIEKFPEEQRRFYLQRKFLKAL